MASIRQVLQHRQIPVVVGIGGVVDWSNHLQGIDDDQHGVGVCGEECFYLLLQSLTDERALCAEVDAVRCVLGDLKEPVLDTENGVLQTEVEGGTLFGGHIPDRFSFARTYPPLGSRQECAGPAQAGCPSQNWADV